MERSQTLGTPKNSVILFSVMKQENCGLLTGISLYYDALQHAV